MVIPLLTEPFDPEVAAEQPAQIVSLATAAVTEPASDMVQRDVGTRSRRSRGRWIVAAVACMSIVLVLSFVVVSSFVAEPSLAAEPPTRTIAPRSTWSPPVSDAAAADVEAVPPVDHDAVAASTSGGPPPPSAGSAAAPTPRVLLPDVSMASTHVTTVPPSGAEFQTVVKPRVSRLGDTVSNTRAPTAISPSAAEAPVAKSRVRAPPNRRLQPAVDERDCPTKGSQEVTIDSFPPGVTIYLNHKECGELGTTPWRGKLPPSKGSATGTFTAILERRGEDPVTQEFTVLKSTRIQRVQVRMPPKQ
jgi:hypothetical protein